MKVLSVKQPWASLIIAGVKDVENRSWNTNFRGQFAIHACQSIDLDNALKAYFVAAKIWKLGLVEAKATMLSLLGVNNLYEDLPKGCIIGTVELSECTKEVSSLWHFENKYGFYLKNPKKFETPIYTKG